MRLFSQLVTCIVLLLAAGSYTNVEAAPGIVVYYSAHNSYQVSLASAINKNLNSVFSSIPVRFITNEDLSPIHPGDMILSIGNQKKIDAALDMLKNDVIYINDTEDNDHNLRQNLSYINLRITQPPCRQLELISILNKHWKRVGFLMNRSNDKRLALLHTCSKGLNLEIYAVQIINGDLPVAIDKLLQKSDVLLALPDYKIYNRHSVKDILLSAYRLRIPVVGFSDSFVNAGAIAATYSSPDQIARQLVSIILDKMKNGKLPDSGKVYPKYFSVSINKQVASALDLYLPSENSIKSSIQRMEAKQ
jgi:hypothetical protein